MEGINITFKPNQNPKSDRSPQYFVEAEGGWKGVAWDAEEEFKGEKKRGFSIKIFKPVGDVAPAKPTPTAPKIADSTSMERAWDNAMKDAPVDDIPF